MTQTPSMTTQIVEYVNGRFAQLNLILPARVLNFNSSTYSINAQIVIPRSLKNSEGDRVIEKPAVINDVPLVMLGSGGTRIKFPISVGDSVLLMACSRSIEKWITESSEADPKDDRHHNLDDAVAIPGIQAFNVAKDASPQIEFTTSGEIHAGGSEELTLQTVFDAFLLIYNSHTHLAAGVATATPVPLQTLPVARSVILKGS